MHFIFALSDLWQNHVMNIRKSERYNFSKFISSHNKDIYYQRGF